MLILRLRKIEEIEKIAEGDEELMKVANELKRLSLDINTVGLYNEAEEMEKMMNSLREEGEMLGEKKGIKKVLIMRKSLLLKIFLRLEYLKKV